MPFVFYIFIFLSLPLLGQASLPTYHYFKGSFNDQYAITMELKQKGNQIEGSYFYDKYRTNIPLKGIIQPDKTLILTEIDANGNTTSSIFTGTLHLNWVKITGQWQNKTKEKKFKFDLYAINLPEHHVSRYNFDNIRRFQEFLNFFEHKPALPFQVQQGISPLTHWENTTHPPNTPISSYQQTIPYRLAKRYIMNQIKLQAEGSYNYFNLPADVYASFDKHYSALCRVYQNNNYISLLCRFKCDTGWENYDITFLLFYDYAGHLLDACTVGKVLDLEGNNRRVNADWSSNFEKGGRIEVKGKTKELFHTDIALKQQIHMVHFYWLVQANGRLLHKDIISQ